MGQGVSLSPGMGQGAGLASGISSAGLFLHPGPSAWGRRGCWRTGAAGGEGLLEDRAAVAVPAARQG